ncbi:MAG: hypothetical protein U9R74_15490 [Pseudomonadota bacterium]|nr:hypothetical protein [Pseudomonadota bacterium]
MDLRGLFTYLAVIGILAVWHPAQAQVGFGGFYGDDPANRYPGDGFGVPSSERGASPWSCVPRFYQRPGPVYDGRAWSPSRSRQSAYREYRERKRERLDRYRAWRDQQQAEVDRRRAPGRQSVYAPRYLTPPVEQEDVDGGRGEFVEKDEGEPPYELGQGARHRF